jgi:hypothetical protein
MMGEREVLLLLPTLTQPEVKEEMGGGVGGKEGGGGRGEK